MKTRTTKTTKTIKAVEPVVYRTGCWHEDAPVRTGAFRLLIAGGDSFGPRYVGGSTGMDLSMPQSFIVFNGEVDARACAVTLPAGLEVEYHRYDGQNWRNVGAGVVQARG